nr:hypothetical protein [Planococcus salinarum]
MVQRLVGFFDHFLKLGSAGSKGHSNRNRQNAFRLVFFPFEMEFLDIFPNPLRKRRSFSSSRGAWRQQINSSPHSVRPHPLSEWNPSESVPQTAALVAFLMAVRVVIDFEIIDIQHDDCHRICLSISLPTVFLKKSGYSANASSDPGSNKIPVPFSAATCGFTVENQCH